MVDPLSVDGSPSGGAPGTVPFASVSGYAYAILFAVLFGIAGLIHRTVTRRNHVLEDRPPDRHP
ncbi:hypothetical protein [Halorubrum sp. HHNYT27]|uniref:hypothetical protein n=1 Tax=Halorubrum sp. HHNYT27 TaxID=3402275 RepID=UPI003EBD0E3E